MKFKEKAEKSKSVSSQPRINSKDQSKQFVNNRMEADAQDQRQKLVNNSPKVTQLQSIQKKANNNSTKATIQFGKGNRKGKGGRNGKRGQGVGNSGSQRQGKKGQRDKKHGLMMDPVLGKEFIAWLHKKKQKSGRRNDFTAAEIRVLQVEFLKEKGLVGDVEVAPQQNIPKFPPSDDEDDESGGGGGGGIAGSIPVAPVS